MRLIVAYIRVSTDRQGKSGLGLEAQQAAIEAYAALTGGKVLRVYVEVITGKRNDRKELAKALAHARRSGAVLAVGVLDRLSRNSYLINKLLETGVDFVDCQSPHDSPFVTRIKAAVAQEELEKISRRTRDALAAAKARGKVLGCRPGHCPIPVEARKIGARNAGQVVAEKARESYIDLVPLLLQWRNAGLTQQQIAEKLADEGHTTRRGAQFSQSIVSRVLRKYCGA